MKMVRTNILTCVAGLLVVASLGCSPSGSFKVTPIPADRKLKERIVYRHPGWVSDRIALIDITGVLLNAHEMKILSEGEHPVSLVVEKLSAAAADRRVKAIVLRINSPGGTVTAADTLYEEILAFKKKTGKPVVAYFQDVAASGAYYLACAADEIIAQRTSITGSIGVLMQMIDVSGTMAKLGISADAITSGPYKDAGSPFRAMRPEERAIFQRIVDQYYQQFIRVVTSGRPNLAREDVAKLADGRVYVAEQALELGLIDRIATLEEAIEAARRRAGVDAAHTVIYHRPVAWAPNIYASPVLGAPRSINLFSINLPDLWTNRPLFLYIWSVSG